MGLLLNSFSDVPGLFFLLIFISSFTAACSTRITGINVDNPAVEVTPIFPVGHGLSNGAGLCERVQVAGISRWKLGKYSSIYRLIAVPSVVIPERLHSKIQICFHKNSSLGLCQCEKDDWKNFHKGMWMSVMSPYEDRYVDVKFVGDFPGSVTVSVEEEFQGWRLIFCVLGIFLLLLAPVISSWVPFYYSSSMAIGVCLVIIILLFQGMKLLPTGRKNIFYITIYGSVLGAGSFLVHHFTVFVNSILINFGLGEEMHNPVSVFLIVGIVIAGAGLGYWLVRKFVISDDGRVDVGIAQFVKWAIRIVAVTLVFQSTLDTILALILLGSVLAIWYFVPSVKWHEIEDLSYPSNGSLWARRSGHGNKMHKRAEFFSRSGKKYSFATARNNTKGASPMFERLQSPSHRVAQSQQDCYSRFNGKGKRNQQDFYSTYHRTPDRKKYSKQDWDDFTEESTRQAVAELASCPEFTDWVMKNADRIKLVPDDSSDESIESGSDSTDEHAVESSSGFRLFRW